MNVQLRHPAGTPTGGQFAETEKPAVSSAPLSLNDDGTDTCEVYFNDLLTVFTRSINEDGFVEVATNTDDPVLWKLAVKGNDDYWSHSHHKVNNQQMWAASIVAEMIAEGLVATDIDRAGHWSGVDNAMLAVQMFHPGTWASRTDCLRGPHALTGHVAQTRALRLVQSLMPCKVERSGSTLSGGDEVHTYGRRATFRTRLLLETFDRLKPAIPHSNTGYVPLGTERLYVGPNRELLWRAWTEPDFYGLTALKTALLASGGGAYETVVDAALYDPEAQRQLTTGLFEGLHGVDRGPARDKAVAMFERHHRNPLRTDEQQTRIHGFIETIETLPSVAVTAVM